MVQTLGCGPTVGSPRSSSAPPSLGRGRVVLPPQRGLDQAPSPGGPPARRGRNRGNHQPGPQKGKSALKEQSKRGAQAREARETEQSARPSRKPRRSQQMPKWFGSEAPSSPEAVPDRPRQSKNLAKGRPTRTKAGLASGEETTRPEVKSQARKNQALKKPGDARGERNGAERGRRGNGPPRPVNEDDSGRPPTRGEGKAREHQDLPKRERRRSRAGPGKHLSKG